MEKLSKNCKQCGKEFQKPPNVSRASWFGCPRRPNGVLFCSKSCAKKGKPSWNKGKPRTWDSPGDFKKGQDPWNKGKKWPEMEGRNNPNWKEEGMTMTALHNWVRRKLGKPSECEFCGLNDPKRMYHWSNISGEYKRDLDDWQRLCVPCHKKFDLSK